MAYNLQFLSLNYLPEQIGIGPYSADLALYLSGSGMSIDITTSKPFYPAWKVDPDFRKPGRITTVSNGINIDHCTIYVPSRPTGPRRILHHLSFLISTFPVLLRKSLRSKPDILFSVAPSLIGTVGALAISWWVKSPLWLHIQDFEVDAAFATDLIDKRSIIGMLASRFEKAVLSRCNVVSAISPQMCDLLVKKGVSQEKVFEFRNGSNLNQIKPLTCESLFRSKWSIGPLDVVLYSGNISNKQGISILEEVARLLKHRDDIIFVICGDGSNLFEFKAKCSKLSNVRFFPLQPRERLSDLLGLATIHVLPQIGGAEDLVLPSKMTNMLASGRPIVATASKGSGIAKEIEGCGIAVRPGDARGLADAILMLVDDKALRDRMGHEARRRAVERWDKDEILARVYTRMIKLVERGTGGHSI